MDEALSQTLVDIDDPPVTTAEFISTTEALRCYQDMVYAIALTHTRQRQDADDVFQEVFLVYHRKRPVFDSEDRRRAWLITTTLNCARQQTGSSWSRKVLPLHPEESQQLLAADRYFASDEQEAIFQALQKLPENYRTVLYLFYFEDLSTAMIADVLAVSVGAVRVQLSRGRAQMKTLLKGAYFDA